MRDDSISQRTWSEGWREAGSTLPPTIAVLLPDLRPGGAERIHVSMAKEWLRNGIRVEFVLRQASGELLCLLPEGATVVDLCARRVRNTALPLVRYLRSARPDALLAAMWPLTVVAPVAARLAGFRGNVVVSEHSPLSIAYGRKGWVHNFSMRVSQRFAYPLADARVAVSRGLVRDLARLSGLPQAQFKVIHNPAALGKAGEAMPSPVELEGVSRPLIITVGTLKQVKRHDLLIEAFARLPAELGATLCIVGDGPERAALEAKVATRGLSSRVLLPGFAADPAPWYAKADLFVLSSDYEGFGNVIVEALEQGTPVVSTDCPAGPREILDDGRYGRLVPLGDVDALSKAMLETLHSPPDSAALKARAQDFAVSKIADQYLNVLFPNRHDPVPA